MLVHRATRRPKNTLPLGVELRLEQMLAFGRSDKWIMRELGVQQAHVDDVRLWLEECNAEPPPHPRTAPHGTRYGYVMHGREGTTPCPDCRAAWAKTKRESRARVRDAFNKQGAA